MNEKFYGKNLNEDKSSIVNQVFNSVSSNYDLMNDLMSIGLHRIWKNNFIKLIDNFNGVFLDVASGTGDIALKIHEHAQKIGSSPKIYISDINPRMIKKGISRLIDDNKKIFGEYLCLDGENIPFADNSFDYITVSFGARNITNLDAFLGEACRILKNGGKLLCMEFSKVNNPLLEKFYRQYLKIILPFLGKNVANDQDAYEYLAESILRFPSQSELAKKIKKAGFAKVSYQDFTKGIVAVHVATKQV